MLVVSRGEKTHTKPENEGESMQRVLMLSASVVAMTWAANAVADSPNLKGAYGFTGTAACLVAPGHVGDPTTPPPLANPTPGVALANSGFDGSLHPKDPSSAFSHSNAVEGIRTFNAMAPEPSRVHPLASLFVRPQDQIDFRISRRAQVPRFSTTISLTRSMAMAVGTPRWYQAATAKRL